MRVEMWRNNVNITCSQWRRKGCFFYLKKKRSTAFHTNWSFDLNTEKFGKWRTWRFWRPVILIHQDVEGPCLKLCRRGYCQYGNLCPASSVDTDWFFYVCMTTTANSVGLPNRLKWIGLIQAFQNIGNLANYCIKVSSVSKK